MLLANHGPVVSGRDLDTAVYAIEELEETAKLFFLLRDTPRGRSPDLAGRRSACRLPVLTTASSEAAHGRRHRSLRFFPTSLRDSFGDAVRSSRPATASPQRSGPAGSSTSASATRGRTRSSSTRSTTTPAAFEAHMRTTALPRSSTRSRASGLRRRPCRPGPAWRDDRHVRPIALPSSPATASGPRSSGRAWTCSTRPPPRSGALQFSFDPLEAGAALYARTGEPFPDDTFARARGGRRHPARGHGPARCALPGRHRDLAAARPA